MVPFHGIPTADLDPTDRRDRRHQHRSARVLRALNNLAESLYFDFKRDNVRVCLVSPGFIKTPMTDKNDFKMPFIKTPEYAADKIYDGLINKNVFEIHFPKTLTITLKLLSFLPSKIYFSLIGKMTKYQKK